MTRNKQQRKGEGRKVYSIIVDGETEFWYFQKMKEHESLPKIDLKPDLPSKKKLKEQYETVVENAQNYHQVIWMLDFDTIAKESKETKKGRKPKLQEFREYVQKLKKYKNVEVLINTPCFEFWLLLHFEQSGTYFSDYDHLVKELKKKGLLHDYDKSEKYFKKRNNDLYHKIRPYQETAISNATKLGDFDFENPETAKAEIYKLFEKLGLTKQK